MKKDVQKKEDKLKYPAEYYEEVDLYQDMDCDITNHTQKMVKVRKEHVCFSCQKKIEKGEYALRESGFSPDGSVSAYTCKKCVEDWMEECGMVDSEEEPYE